MDQNKTRIIEYKIFQIFENISHSYVIRIKWIGATFLIIYIKCHELWKSFKPLSFEIDWTCQWLKFWFFYFAYFRLMFELIFYIKDLLLLLGVRILLFEIFFQLQHLYQFEFEFTIVVFHCFVMTDIHYFGVPSNLDFPRYYPTHLRNKLWRLL